MLRCLLVLRLWFLSILRGNLLVISDKLRLVILNQSWHPFVILFFFSMMMQFCKAEYQLFFDSSKRLIL